MRPRSNGLSLNCLRLAAFISMIVPCCKREVQRSQPAAPVPSPTPSSSDATVNPVMDALVDGAHDATSSDQVRKFISCNEQSDCPVLRPGTPCGYACDGGTCRLNYINVAKLGAGPCYGNSLRNYSDLEVPLDRTPAFKVACDLEAGVYCDMGTHRCASVKAAGGTCLSDAECGAYGMCTSGKCAAAPHLGESCTVHCGARAYCDVSTNKCERLLEPGEPCTSSDACRLGYCRGRCDDARQLPCPVPLPTWNGDLSAPR